MRIKQGLKNLQSLLALTKQQEEKQTKPAKDKNKEIIGWLLLLLGAGTFLINKILGGLLILLTFVLIKLNNESKPKKLVVKDIDVFTGLPLELESLIMTIESGNDVVQGLKKVSELEFNDNIIKQIFRDLISRFSSGLSFSDAIESVKEKYKNQTVSFVLNYLKVAIKEGGEIRDQLKELADTVFQQYEFFIDKEVNKMPAKALLPVMIILVGMLINFLAHPVTIFSRELPKIFKNFGTSLSAF